MKTFESKALRRKLIDIAGMSLIYGMGIFVAILMLRSIM